MSLIDILWLVGIFVVLIFSFVIFFGAPFLPTLPARTFDALDLLDLKAGQTMLELGSGDGRMLREAAKRGIRGIGYELNPLLVIYSRLLSWRYRKLVTIKWGNFFRHELPKTDGIYAFLLTPFMAKLDKKIVQEYRRPVKLVSFAYKIPNRKPTKEKNGQFLYIYR